jgi:hypothetical protein
LCYTESAAGIKRFRTDGKLQKESDDFSADEINGQEGPKTR